VSGLRYLTLWRFAASAVVSVSMFVLAWQGRRCSGDIGLLHSAEVYSVPGTTDSASVILAQLPGCALNSAWFDFDFEVRLCRRVCLLPCSKASPRSN
jgi:hypothetical protein